MKSDLAFEAQKRLQFGAAEWFDHDMSALFFASHVTLLNVSFNPAEAGLLSCRVPVLQLAVSVCQSFQPFEAAWYRLWISHHQ